METIEQKIEKLKNLIKENVITRKEQRKIVYFDGSERNWLFDFREYFSQS